jgi:redox-sensitive bicupin YhaK (pirin superfamily)
MGPEIFRAGRELDVAPHPQLGLTTMTYLFEVEFCTVARRNDAPP